MAESFSTQEWEKIHTLAGQKAEEFGLPERRADSVVIGSFNIRKLGAKDRRSAGAWRMLAHIVERFDLLAIQEVLDNLQGLQKLKSMLGETDGTPVYGMVASDITGSYPGQSPPPERLAYLFRWDRVERTEVASDISYDRSSVIETLYDFREAFKEALDSYTSAMHDWFIRKAEREAEGRKPPAKPVIRLPEFVTFIRQPSCVTFRIRGEGEAKPYEFLAVNAHLLFGRYADERYMEFKALVGWLVDRAKQAERLYHKDILLLGDLNLDLDNPIRDRERINQDLKALNQEDLADSDSATLYFPFLDAHPKHEKVLRSNARLNQTYDQIAFVARDPRLPTPEVKASAGADPDGFDYGVFNFVELFSQALHDAPFEELSKKDRNSLLRKFEHDLSDHMPIWIRLPKPAAT